MYKTQTRRENSVNKNFMNVEEVASELGVSKSFAYKVINQLNKELKNKGYLVVAGRINRAYFNEKLCYSKERDD